MKKYKSISNNELKKISGGKGISIPLPNWDQALSGICGFLDGWNGKKPKGHC